MGSRGPPSAAYDSDRDAQLNALSFDCLAASCFDIRVNAFWLGFHKRSQTFRIAAVTSIHRDEILASGNPNELRRHSLALGVAILHDRATAKSRLRELLGYQLWVERCWLLGEPAEAERVLRSSGPQVVVVAIRASPSVRSKICRTIRGISPRSRILLVGPRTAADVAAARSDGVAGVMAGDSTDEDLVGAIRLIGTGSSVFPRRDREAVGILSPRERSVLKLMSRGLMNNEIASELDLSRHTIKEYVSSRYRKLGVHNRAGAVLRAAHYGFDDVSAD
jgi:DNA-binding NarL/FixJ family response regulator